MQPNLLRNRCFLPTKNTKYWTFYRTHFLLISLTCLSRYISLSFIAQPYNQPREPQPYEDCQAKSVQEFGWTLQGMDWGWGQGIKTRATSHRRVKEFGLQLSSEVSYLAKEKKNWTGCPVVESPLFRWEQVLYFIWKPKAYSLEEGWKAHSPSCLKAQCYVPQSVMIWGAMSSAGVGPLCFFETNVTAAGFGTCPHCQKHQCWLNDHGLVCLTGQQTLQIWTP